ncbi:uncharacterized protein N7518_006714 [Penicillium psychrosexuale]|uniref:uncharacterized protein n=1 Tax=Penicillium psychrosexuale TaxID=1002107 RepID=UPI0025453502|nr:uncharacterized protein N7518_006714 [Penicillium psychrosexuale]KAJ5789703.1 hypothetical protein N7518_006714 [Penicillium psychrosexuale]
MTHQTIDGIPGENIRGQEDQFQLERNGFTIQHGSPVQRFSRVEEGHKVPSFDGGLRASRVDVFRHGVQLLPPTSFLTSSSRYENRTLYIQDQMNETQAMKKR